MKYNFDEITDRRNTNSLKWSVGENELPMWVADMDFKTAPSVTEALTKRAAHGIFGYAVIPNEWYEAYMSWWKNRYSFKIEKDWLIFATGVVPAISSIVRKLTTPAENVLILTPVYNIFFNSILNNGRNVFECPLSYKNKEYGIDFEDLEKKLSDPQTTMMILCNPHNPVGRVWTEDELYRMSEICARNHVVVISDEIHSDLMLYGHKHIPMGTLGTEEMRSNVITCFAPSKTFNCAGLRGSAIVVPNPQLRALMNKQFKMNRSIQQNIFAIPALVAGYTQCEDYVEQLLPYLEKNVDFVRSYLAQKMPKIRLVEPEATFLLWLDCTELGIRGDELAHFWIDECLVGISRGDGFGEEGANFIRLNIGCPTQRLEIALDRVYAQYRKRF